MFYSTVIVLLFSSSIIVEGHECYVCQNQTTNDGKCSRTVSVCDHEERACRTVVSWDSLPVYGRGDKLHHFVSKSCVSYEACEREKQATMHRCTYLSYQNWACVHCCLGNRCNYYIIDSGSSCTVNILLSISAVMFLLLSNARFSQH